MTRPAGLIDPLLDRIDLGDLARLMFERHRGRERRVKTRDLAAALLGVVARHGSAEDVAIREAIGHLVTSGCPIAGEPGATGGFFWLGAESERQAVLIILRANVRALQRRIDGLQHARLDAVPIRVGQQRLFQNDPPGVPDAAPDAAPDGVKRVRDGGPR